MTGGSRVLLVVAPAFTSAQDALDKFLGSPRHDDRPDRSHRGVQAFALLGGQLQ
jgi:hypothetical protein